LIKKVDMNKNKERNHSIQPDFPKQEQEILSFWKKNKIFEKSLAKNKDKHFIFLKVHQRPTASRVSIMCWREPLKT